MTPIGVVGLRDDGVLVWVDPAGAIDETIRPDPGQQITKLIYRNHHLLATLTSSTGVTGRWVELEPLRWGNATPPDGALVIAAVARGKVVFESAGCSDCHAGVMYTDQTRHKLGGTLLAADTPSLIGLATSAPYFHDGSAATLEVVLRERGAVHGMSPTAQMLGTIEVTNLIAFLESL
ncbi:MAG: c-type cytochrome [Proteobacteria bacterium]|nr:c-type cytochrome [Pseudomonadota bacterium]